MSTDTYPRFLSHITNVDSVNLALRLTLLNLLLTPIGDWTLRPFILSLASLGLVFPVLLRNPALWLALTILTGLRVIFDWPLADNHAYLFCYWCLAVFIAVSVKPTQDCLALNGRLLIGWVFLFATLWKLVLSPDYFDGLFFRVIMITDPRFEGFAQLAGGLSMEMLADLRSFIQQPVYNLATYPDLIVQEPARFIQVASMAAIWNILIDALIAIAFLWPVDRGISRYRDDLLIIFCLVTYAVATVAGFGWLLIAMGVAQCEVKKQSRLILYLITFLAILLYREIPWATLLLSI